MLNEMATKVEAAEFKQLYGALNRALRYGVLTKALEANHLSIAEIPPLKQKGAPFR